MFLRKSLLHLRSSNTEDIARLSCVPTEMVHEEIVQAGLDRNAGRCRLLEFQRR